MAVGGQHGSDGPSPLVAEESTADGGGRPRLGPWLATSRIRQPCTTRVPTRGRKDPKKDKKSGPDSSDPYSSPPLSSLRNTTSSPPNSSSDFDGWQMLTKVARRRSPGTSSSDAAGEGIIAGSGFSTLGPLRNVIDLGLEVDQGPRDATMVDPSMIALKRARSPPKEPTPGSSAFSTSKVSSSSAGIAFVQVSSSNPCMDGGRVEGGVKIAAHPISESRSPGSAMSSSGGPSSACAKYVAVYQREKIAGEPVGGDGVLCINENDTS